MHISDGVLSPQFVLGTTIVAILLIFYSYKSGDENNIVKTSFFTALFFFITFIKIPISFISIHLVFNSLLGIVLKKNAPIAFLISLFFQAIFFANGGLSSLGANVLIMSSGAFLSSYLYTRFQNKIPENRLHFLVGFSSIMCSSIVLLLLLLGSYDTLKEIAWIVFLANTVLAVTEGIMMIYILKFMKKRKVI